MNDLSKFSELYDRLLRACDLLDSKYGPLGDVSARVFFAGHRMLTSRYYGTNWSRILNDGGTHVR